MITAKYRSDAALDVRPVLAAVSAPTLVMHNATDPFIEIDSSRAIADGIPGARFVELQGDLHLSWRPDDYAEMVAGIAVHIGARVAQLAGPGEVLVTGTVRDLVAGSGLTFTSRGTEQLKGVPGEWSVLAVDVVG